MSSIGGAGVAGSHGGFVRWLLPACWAVAGVGCYGPWIAHPTAALSLSGGDMGEFVKFLPGVLNGTLKVTRQLFYLPPVAVVVGIALMLGARPLRYGAVVRLSSLLLALVLSLQLLPPAWSQASLATAEFRFQVLTLAGCWLLLLTHWVWGRVPMQLTGAVVALLSAVAVALPAWQWQVVRPAIAEVYGAMPPVGWGYVAGLAGLVGLAATGLALAVSLSTGAARRGGK